MARYNTAIEVTFNDNDGGAGWKANPQSADDVQRHVRIFGLWRTRWILFKKFWRALRWLEEYQRPMDARKLWVFKPEIPE